MKQSVSKKTPAICVALLTTLFIGNSHAQTANQKSAGTANAPVENRQANSNYKPAFAGQTRIGSIKTKTPITVTLLSKALERPWGISTMPDGRFLVSQKTGGMVIITPKGAIAKKITGLPEVASDGQGGLLDVKLDPDFTKNRMIYWGFSEPTETGSVLAIAKGRLSNDDTKVENVEVIYRAGPIFKGSLHFGSRIVFDKNGNLFVSAGERSSLETRPKAQALDASLGKIVHITKAGKPVPGGPFAGVKNAKPEIYAYGFRNPQGLAINPTTGDLWEAEFGPRGGDEINIVKPGKNYGWPVITYGIEYSGEKVGAGIQQKAGLEQPVYYWDPVVSPSGIIFYNSNVIPEWKGNLFVGGLSSTHIARLVIKNNKVVAEERLVTNEGERFRALTVGTDGAIYAVTDGGRLYKIAKK